MKKPNLRDQFEKETGTNATNIGYGEVGYNKEYVQWLEIINSEVIDALVQAYEYMDIGDGFVREDIKQALIKAGCIE